MKKLFLLTIFAMACVFTTKANYIQFINMSGCTFTYHVAGVDPANPTTMFASSPITVPPGNLNFATPNTLPGLPGLSATVNYYFVRGWVNSSPTMPANVGNFPTQGFPTSMTLPALPCNGSTSTSVSFNGNSTGGNVIVLIF